MSKPVRLDREAEEEIDAAASWYEENRAGLGLDLADAVREALMQLRESPRRFPLVPGFRGGLSVRRCPIRRFPYSLVLIELAGEIRVLAAAHDRRSPGYWRSRV